MQAEQTDTWKPFEHLKLSDFVIIGTVNRFGVTIFCLIAWSSACILWLRVINVIFFAWGWVFDFSVIAMFLPLFLHKLNFLNFAVESVFRFSNFLKIFTGYTFHQVHEILCFRLPYVIVFEVVFSICLKQRLPVLELHKFDNVPFHVLKCSNVFLELY